MRRIRSIYPYIIAILLVLTIPTTVVLSGATNIVQQNMGIISFNRLVSWEEAMSFSRAYGVKPISLYMSSFGLSGSYRRYDRVNPDKFWKDVEQRSLYVFRKSIEGNVRLIKNFLQKHSIEDITKDDDVLAEGRSLLILHYQLVGMYNTISRKGNIIYAMEVYGMDDDNIKGIESDEIVSNVIRFSKLERILKRIDPPNDDISYKRILKRVNSMSPQRVHKELRSIIMQWEGKDEQDY